MPCPVRISCSLCISGPCPNNCSAHTFQKHRLSRCGNRIDATVQFSKKRNVHGCIGSCYVTRVLHCCNSIFSFFITGMGRQWSQLRRSTYNEAHGSLCVLRSLEKETDTQYCTSPRLVIARGSNQTARSSMINDSMRDDITIYTDCWHTTQLH